MGTFAYHPLEIDSHFRILYLDPGAIYEPLSGSLTCCDINKLPRPLYDCLSYTWGSPTLSHEILIDGSPLPITANLHSALRCIRARTSHGKTAIWADGICINQNDTAERNQQVALMKRIYSECCTGLIYLGEAANESDLVPEFLETLTESTAKLLRQTKNPSKYDPENDFMFPEEEDPGWRRLVSFLGRPWFRRVWVIQEFVFPPDLRLICGDWEIPGTYLASLLSVPIWNYSHRVGTALTDERINVDGTDIGVALSLQSMHLQIRNAHGRALGLGLDEEMQRTLSITGRSAERSLFWLLSQTSLCEATDLRDKMFAILSLAPDAVDSSLAADYSLSTTQVALKFGEHLIRTGYGLSLLESNTRSNGTVSNLPSWLPDWTDPQDALVFSIWPRRFDTHPECDISIETENRTLSVRGYFIDTVQALGLPMHNKDWNLEWIASIDALVQDIPSYPCGQPVAEAVWRTIIADRSVDGTSPAPNDYATFYRWSRDAPQSIQSILGDSSTMSEWDQWAAIRSISKFQIAILLGSRFCVTERGLFGMLPERAEIGDRVFVVKGDSRKATFLVRWDPAVGRYRWIGHAYVHKVWEVVEMDRLDDTTVVVC